MSEAFRAARRPSTSRFATLGLAAALLSLTTLPVAATARDTQQQDSRKTAQNAPPGAARVATAPNHDPANWLFKGSDFPVDPAWRWGTLPNGVRFAVRRGEVPAGLVSVRVRIDAGSLVEADDELGYAHLMEHMAFRGSEALGDGEIRKLWQRLGVTFGSDSNAETTPTHTVFKLDLPNANAGLEEAMGALAGMVRTPALTDAAVATERQVVLAELAEAGAAQRRVGQLTQGHLFQGLRLAKRPVIGTAASLGSATAPALRAFHERWYRPERTVIAMVGDVDPERMIQAIERQFGDWRGRGPATPTPAGGTLSGAGPTGLTVVEPTIPLAVEYARVRQHQVRVDTIANTEGLYRDYLATLIINRRLERRARAGAPYLEAGVQQQVIGQLADATIVSILPVDGNWQGALADVRGVIADALAKPPSPEDIAREAIEIETSLARELANARNENSRTMADDIVSAVDNNEVLSSPQIAADVFQTVKRGVTPDAILAATRRLFDGPATRVVVTSPVPLAGAERAIAAITAKPATPLADVRLDTRRVTGADLPALGPAGKVVSSARIGTTPLRQVTLANGVRAMVMESDAEPDRIRVKVRFGHGRRALPADTPSLVWTGDYALVASGVGALDDNALDRLLNGRQLGMRFEVGDNAFAFSGETNRADLPDQLKLLAAKLGAPRWDPRPVARLRAAMLAGYDARRGTAGDVLGAELDWLVHHGDARYAVPDRAAIAALDADAFRRFWAPILANGPIEVQVGGDVAGVDVDRLLAETFGALDRAPAGPKAASPYRLPPAGLKPIVARHGGDADQAAGVVTFATRGGFDLLADRNALEAVSAIIRDRLLQRLREEAGASYSPDVRSVWPLDVADGGTLSAIALVNTADLPRFYALVDDIAADLRAKPIEADELARVVTPLTQAVERLSSSNQFIQTSLEGVTYEPRYIEALMSLLREIGEVTPEDIQRVAIAYLTPERRWRGAVLATDAPVPGPAPTAAQR